MSALPLSVAELELLRQRITRGDLECPLSPDLPSLASLAQRAPLLFGHDRDATVAILTAILAERATPRPQLELVWTGPDAAASQSRDTAVVVRELFLSAQKSILIAGYSFDHGADILRPLYEAMRDRAVTVELYIDIPRMKSAYHTVEAHVAREIDDFLGANWPFGPPLPHIFYDPRTVSGDEYASIHAKCVVVDERTTLIGSANFTDRAQSRNIEVGVKIEDAGLSTRLVHQFRQATHQGHLLRCR